MALHLDRVVHSLLRPDRMELRRVSSHSIATSRSRICGSSELFSTSAFQSLTHLLFQLRARPV